jgi:hypothetical protein
VVVHLHHVLVVTSKAGDNACFSFEFSLPVQVAKNHLGAQKRVLLRLFHGFQLLLSFPEPC